MAGSHLPKRAEMVAGGRSGPCHCPDCGCETARECNDSGSECNCQGKCCNPYENNPALKQERELVGVP
jgi:hypothetical protein